VLNKIVISGVGLFAGGTLSIFQDCLNQLEESSLSKSYVIEAFVYDASLFPKYSRIRIKELKFARTSWLHRLYVEYFWFYSYSKRHNIDLWFSIHDITPRVRARKRAVYCHNPSPFYKMTQRELLLDPKLKLFTLFYRYLYGLGIRNNDQVVVQQGWLARRFISRYKVKNVIVDHPSVAPWKPLETRAPRHAGKRVLFYPTFPRVFKNIEILGEVAKALGPSSPFFIVVTVSGDENPYAKYLYRTYGSVENLEFCGRLSREDVYSYYQEAEALIFPSKLETWGLPISEFAQTGKPIFVASCAYAKETVGNYPNARFFNPDRVDELLNLIQSLPQSFKPRPLSQTNVCNDGWINLVERLLN